MPTDPPPTPDPWEELDENAEFIGIRRMYPAEDVWRLLAAERQQATAQQAEDYINGRIVAYCEMVKRGSKLASTQGIRHDQLAAVTALIAREGCLCRHGQANNTFVHLWIYTDPALVPVLDALADSQDSPLYRFAFGKLCGYSDVAVMEFEKRQQLQAEVASLTQQRDEARRQLAALAVDPPFTDPPP